MIIRELISTDVTAYQALMLVGLQAHPESFRISANVVSFSRETQEKLRHKAVKNNAVYVALGVTLQGEKELLGLWVSHTEGAKFWLAIFIELQSRGVPGLFCGMRRWAHRVARGPRDGLSAHAGPTLSGLVHKVRQSLRYVIWKERQAVARDLRTIWGPHPVGGRGGPGALLGHLGCEISDHQCELAPGLGAVNRLLRLPPAMRKVIYTTNAIESLNYSLCKVFKGRGAFPTDEAILKVLYLGMQRIAEKWTTPIPEWKRALNQFALLLGDRVPTA